MLQNAMEANNKKKFSKQEWTCFQYQEALTGNLLPAAFILWVFTSDSQRLSQ